MIGIPMHGYDGMNEVHLVEWSGLMITKEIKKRGWWHVDGEFIIISMSDRYRCVQV